MKKNKKIKNERTDHVLFLGEVTDIQKGVFKVKFEHNENSINCRVNGKMRQAKIMILLGDRVEVKFSVYDTINNGIISKRL